MKLFNECNRIKIVLDYELDFDGLSWYVPVMVHAVCMARCSSVLLVCVVVMFMEAQGDLRMHAEGSFV
jgi:hypothetical protein